MTCIICGNGESWPIPYRHDAQTDAWRAEAGDHGPHAWRLCARCGNAFPRQQPRLDILQRVWEANRSVDDAEQEQAVWRHRQSISRAGAQRSYRLLAPLASRPGKFLDIACGLGETVRTFSDKGWDAEGIDPDPSLAPFHRQLGIRTRIGQFEQADIGGDYDIIHIAHAIYFITDPMRFMLIVRAHLARDGVFCVVLADFMSPTDPGLPSYAHSFFPTAASMRYALALAGFETVMTRRLSGSIFIVCRISDNPPLPSVNPLFIWLAYRTKQWRYRLLGRPYLLLRQAAKRVLRRGR